MGLACIHLPPQGHVILWKLTLLLIDFLVIQGPALFQKCWLEAKTCSDYGHRCLSSTWRLGVTQMRGQERARN